MGDFAFAIGLAAGILVGWFAHAALIWFGFFGRMWREMDELGAEVKRDNDALKARIARGCRRTDGKI